MSAGRSAKSLLNNQNSQNVLPNWLERSALNHPHRLAVTDSRVSWTFAELDLRVTRLAHQLYVAGLREGDHAALLAGNGLPYCCCVHALTRLGAVLVPLNTRLAVSELTWQLGDSHSTLLIHDEEHATTAEALGTQLPGLRYFALERETSVVSGTIPEAAGLSDRIELGERSIGILRREIDLAATQAIIYTSGTTGQPKGVLVTYGMHWWSAIGSLLNMGQNADDCWLACLPFFHIGGLSILMRSVIYGMRVYVQERFDAAAINELLLHEQISIISVVAVMLGRMLSSLDSQSEAGRYPPTLRCVLLGGGPAPRHLLEDCARRDIPVMQTYGMTESCSQAATLAPEDALPKLGSAGRPLVSLQMQIMLDGRVLPAGEPGEIMLRGPTITPGYAGLPEATAAAFQDGWFATGDFGYLDEQGYLYVLDRRRDLIISGGENVYPAEVEAALLEHPAVLEAGVCGIPNETWGQVPVAFVVLREGVSTPAEGDLLESIATRLARYKLPQRIHFTGQLPRTISGKLLRRELTSLLP